MVSEPHKLLERLRHELGANPYWAKRLSSGGGNQFTIHLAIFREPYLKFIMEGKKTVETRFARRACPPYKCVNDGDVVLLKRAAGGIIGICTIEKAWFYQLDPTTLSFIKTKFGAAICPADSAFWKEREEAVVATLMLVGNVTPIENILINKRDRRGWVVFKDNKQETFWNRL